MKKDSRMLSETRDVISLGALLHEVLAESRERPPRPVPADVRRPAETGAHRAPLPELPRVGGAPGGAAPPWDGVLLGPRGRSLVSSLHASHRAQTAASASASAVSVAAVGRPSASQPRTS